MRRRMWRGIWGIVLPAAAAGCANAREQAAPPPPPPAVVTFTAVNYAFAGPDSVSAGAVTFRIANKGTELHHMTIVRLLQGKTLDSLVSALRHPGPFPAWAQLVGGPNAIAPNDSTQATVTLAAGHYALLCVIPGADGMPHFTKGMIRPLEVTAAASGAAAPAEPVADVTVHLKDYDFVSSAPLTAGHHTIRVVNDGPQPHELTLIQLAPGKSIQDLLAWEQAGMHGPPPGRPIGGMSPLAPGREAQFAATFTPGTYGFICFVPAPDHKEHAQHGMLKQFTIS